MNSNDTNDDPTLGKVCIVCGDSIGPKEGCEMDWSEDIIAFVHITCARTAQSPLLTRTSPQ